MTPNFLKVKIIILGVLHAFGVFFILFIRDFETTKANAAWVGSIAYGLSMLTGPLAGVVINKFGHRVSMMCGGLLCFIALLSSSFVNSLNHLFFTFSFIYGLGTCLCITPTMTLGQDYFEKYLSVSIGIITSGSSIGTLVMAPTSQALIDSVGWRNTFRIYAVACLFTSLFNFFVRPISNTKKTASETLRSSPLRRLIQELALWKNRVFIVWSTGITLVMFGYYIPYVHLISFALDAGITPDQGSILIMVFGASTAIGRLTFGKIVQLGLLNRLHMHQLSMIVCGTATMFLPFIQSFGGLLSYVVFFGMVDGCFVVLLPLMTCSLVQADKAVLAWGFLSGTSSITFTLGPPIAGFLYDSLGSYNVAFHVASIPVIAGALVLFMIPWAQRTSTTTRP
ncbi:monocarboxylate transporter 10 [Patella vulgata]|uniref:monocarboxylate transporter 10 n=1 Tax=Patella vulgata TaxID=6465 RepID=UPI0021807747|nr:monocarboxylate transporter 10 [Patella vulgata]